MPDETLNTFWDYTLWFVLTIAASVVVLVGLLVVIAFLLLIDRKVWAAVQLRRFAEVAALRA